uniref:C-type lectin domain-containing protein n=1 Tax=Acrobeloides nanus TaxID=290746 RepID=A0A914EL43_9BILA
MDGKIAIFVFVLIARLGSDQVNAQVCTHPYCRTGYTYDAATNFCYKYVGTPATYAAATQYCANDCSAIASIRFSQENDFIDKLILQSNTNVNKKTWIGFAVNTQAVQWQWTDQGPITYTNWYQNKPVTAGCINGVAPWGNGNGCVNFQPTGSGCDGGSNYWENFYSCATALPFVCKQTPICGSAGKSS